MSIRRQFWCVWLAIVAVRALLAATVPLFGDEAWYWLEGRRLAWAYSDLPGLTAWLIRVGSELVPASWFGVRLPFLLMSAAVPLLLRAAAREIGDDDHADRAGLLALLLPLLAGSGWLALPDGPLTFATALCLLAMLRLRRRVESATVCWLALGLVLGALSHYRFALLLGAGAIGLLADARARATLSDHRVQLALLAGLGAWLPLLMWNLQHDVAGLTFQFGERHPWHLHTEGVWLPLSQLLVVSPLLLVLLLAALRSAWRARNDAVAPSRMLLVFSAVPLATYLALAFVVDRERVSFHWLLQAWLPLLLLAPTLWLRWSRPWRAGTLALAAGSSLLVFGYAALAALPSARAALAESRWYPDNFAGWEEIAQSVRESTHAHPALRVVADNFMLGAQLSFALQRDDIAVRDHPLNHKHGRAAQLRLWRMEQRVSARDEVPTLLVMEDTALSLRLRLRHYQSLCAEAGALASPQVLQIDHGRKRFLRFRFPVQGDDCVLPAIAWLDQPAPGSALRAGSAVAGWAFKDGAGIAGVQLLVDGRPVSDLRYGITRPEVASYWGVSRDIAHPDVGFEAVPDAGTLPRGEHWLGLRLHGRDGSVEDWPARRVSIGD